MNQDFWLPQFERLGALWIHDGNAKRPHAQLTSGNHSNGFFDASKIIERPDVLTHVCQELVRKNPTGRVGADRVFGSALGACNLAYETARQLNCLCGFTEPTPEKQMILKRFSFPVNSIILVVEDVITTGGTTVKTIVALEQADAKVLPYVWAIFNRSGQSYLGERKIFALIEKELPMWKPDECPLCQLGSVAVRPKANWAALTAAY